MHAFSRGVTAATLLLLALTLAGSAPEAGQPKPTGAAAGPSALPGAAAIRAQLAKLPLAFEPNVGQARADVRYVSLGPSPRLELTDTEVRLTGPAARRGSNVVSLRLAGGARPSRVESQDELPGKVHHFDSNDPQQWRRDIPTFRRVAYRDVYPATDLVFHGSQGAAEFDFVLRPGASPRAIGIDVRGADAVALDGEDVVIRTGSDTLRMHAPVVYQDSATGRKLVDGRFSIRGSRIGFEVGAYDPARPLVIDPVVTYSTYLGGTGSEHGVGVGVDAAGNIYAAIETGATGQFVKLSADGQTLLYSVTLGDMLPHGLVADAAGNAYIVSTCPYSFSGGGPPVCPTRKSLASGRPTSQGDFATYVTKLGPTGAILFSTSMGGLGSVTPGGIGIDEAGNMYATAFAPFRGFPLTRPPFGIGGSFFTVVEAIAADYSRFLYVVEFQASFEPRALAVDRAGAVYVTGIAHEGNFPTTPGVIQPTAPPGEFSTGVVAKIAPDSSLAYATFFGNISTVPTAVAVDAIGHAYLTGSAGPGLPTVNARQPDLAGGASDAFVARLNATASALVFSTYLGGSGDDAATAIGLDSAGNIYLAGPTRSVDFPQQSALPPELGQAGSNFVVEMTPDGRSLVYSTYFADALTGVAALHATPTGTVYLTGTPSAGFPTVRPFQAMPGGAFVATLVPSEPRVFITSPAAGATVSGIVWTDVWVENFAGTSNAFTLTVGSTVVAEGTASNHATLPWDSRLIPPGATTLTATVRDAAGHIGATTLGLIVLNGPPLGVVITSPAAGAVVGGVVWSDIWVEGAAAGPRTFTLSIGGTTLATASASGNHVTLPWDSSRVADGPQVIVATVSDAAGHFGTATRGLIVLNDPALEVFITSPPAGATVGGVVWSDIWVEGPAARRTFTLSIGGTTLATATDFGNHVTLPWDSSRVADGPQPIVATVRDTAGRIGVGTRSVNIQNGLLAGAGPAPRSAIAPTR
jgi:hypothetical protein